MDINFRFVLNGNIRFLGIWVPGSCFPVGHDTEGLSKAGPRPGPSFRDCIYSVIIHSRITGYRFCHERSCHFFILDEHLKCSDLGEIIKASMKKACIQLNIRCIKCDCGDYRKSTTQ